MTQEILAQTYLVPIIIDSVLPVNNFIHAFGTIVTPLVMGNINWDTMGPQGSYPEFLELKILCDYKSDAFFCQWTFDQMEPAKQEFP